MTRHADYKMPDVPKTEPLKTSLSEKLRAAWANRTTPNDDAADDAAKEHTP